MLKGSGFAALILTAARHSFSDGWGLSKDGILVKVGGLRKLKVAGALKPLVLRRCVSTVTKDMSG